jgi:RES domain-containing protein
VIVYRLSSSRFPANSGAGAAIHGGRWNPVGTEVIYTADSHALAALEILAHYAVLPKDFVITLIRIPDHMTPIEVSATDLPLGWNDPASPLDLTQRIGTDWLAGDKSAILKVPSTIIPAAWNYVLNVAHRDFGSIQFLPSIPFPFDPRLK